MKALKECSISPSLLPSSTTLKEASPFDGLNYVFCTELIKAILRRSESCPNAAGSNYPICCLATISEFDSIVLFPSMHHYHYHDRVLVCAR